MPTGVEAEDKPPGGEEPKKLPANWLDTGWKIEQRGVLQIAVSPEGKEYTLWGQRLEPTKEARKTDIQEAREDSVFVDKAVFEKFNATYSAGAIPEKGSKVSDTKTPCAEARARG